MLDSDAQTALTDLRWHWDDAYKINCVDGSWQAIPLSDPSVIISRGAAQWNCARHSGMTTRHGPGDGPATAAPGVPPIKRQVRNAAAQTLMSTGPVTLRGSHPVAGESQPI
jgi:hypothetical protein